MKASPLLPAPYQQATAGWWPAEMGHFCMQNLYFGNLEAPFWYTDSVTEWPFWWSRGLQGHPMATLKPGYQLLLILGYILGASCDPCWSIFCCFPVIWKVKLAASLQFHFCDDLVRETMLESSGCTSYDHSQNKCFCMVSLFPLIHELKPSGCIPNSST